MQRKALFYADASAQLGGGHVRRCLVLADALRRAGWACTFVVAPGSTRIVPHLARSAHCVATVESQNVDVFAVTTGTNFDLAVIDHYLLDEHFEGRCRERAKRILVIDDQARRRHDCDILLDPTLGRSDEHYSGLVPDGAELLLGPGYALMEPGFFRCRLTLPPIEETEGRVFVSFGATDQADLSGRSVSALRMTHHAMRIDVAVGAASPNIEALQRIAADPMAPASIVVDGDDVPGMMAAAVIGIGAGGGMAWERCCVGLPSLIITSADNQLENAKALHKTGAIHWIGQAATVAPGTIAKAAATLIENAAMRHTMREAALAITDGLGVNRLVLELEEPTKTKAGARVSLRPLKKEDGEMMFTWQTAPGARRYARNPLPPSREEHDRWFRAKLTDPQCVFNVVMHNDEPAGVLRYDWRANEQAFEVSILIAAERQGEGVASAALRLGHELLPDSRMLADVDPANVGSATLFEGSGYRRVDQRKYVLSPRALPTQGTASLQY